MKGEILLSAADVPDLALTRFVERAGGDKAKILVLVAGKETLSPRLRKAAGEAKIEVRPVTATDDGSVPDFAGVGGVWIVGDDVPRLRKARRRHGPREGLPRCPRARRHRRRRPARRPRCWRGRRSRARRRAATCCPTPSSNARAAKASKLAAALKANPGRVGYRSGPAGRSSCRGRRLAARRLGQGVRASSARPRRAASGASRSAASSIEDLTALRRAARDRADGFPPAKVGKPVVPKGTLVIIGGGGMPKGMIAKFVELAGRQGGEDRRPADGHARPGAARPDRRGLPQGRARRR